MLVDTDARQPTSHVEMDQQNKALNVQIRQNELLAQKLYGQCRDASGGFRVLTTSLRKLRNILGEIDEALDGSHGGSLDSKVVYRISQCRTVLEKLDVAFTSWKCNNNNDMNASVAAAMRSDLEMATLDLIAIHEILSRHAGTESSAPSDKLMVESSHSSVILSDSQHDASTNTSASDTSSPRYGRYSFSDEKEVYLPPRDLFHEPAPLVTQQGVESTQSSIFVQADPLSMPLREASRSILDAESPIAPGTRVNSAAQRISKRYYQPMKPVDTPVVHSEKQMDQEAVVIDASATTKPVDDSVAHDSERYFNADGNSLNVAYAVKVGPEPGRKPPKPPPPPPRKFFKDVVPVVRPPSPTTNVSSEDLFNVTSPQGGSQPKSEKAPLLPPLDLSPNLTDITQTRRVSAGATRNFNAAKWFAAHAEGRSVSLSSTLDVAPKDEIEEKSSAPEAQQIPSVNPVTPIITVNGNPAKQSSRPTRYKGRRPSAPNAQSTRTQASTRERALSTGDIVTDIEKSPALQPSATYPRPVHRKSIDEALMTHAAFIKQNFQDDDDIRHAPARQSFTQDHPTQQSTSQADSAEHPHPSELPSHSSPTQEPSAPQLPLRRAPTKQSSPKQTSVEQTPIRQPIMPQTPIRNTSTMPWGPDFVGRSPGDGTYYGPAANAEAVSDTVLDEEYGFHVSHFFNNQNWDEAKSHLVAWLDNLQVRSEADTIRRVQHLLGVIASLQGQWDEAISRFISVLSKPVKSAFDLDDGDCAAAYWLGDLYAMKNQRADAFLAYAIAERSTLPMHNANYLPTLSMEQQVLNGLSNPEYKACRASQPPDSLTSSPSLTDPNIISIPVARLCLENVSISTAKAPPAHTLSEVFYLDPSRRRSSYLFTDFTTDWNSLHLHSTTFSPTSPWPLRYDPFFSMANVARGRLLLHETDMLLVLTTNPSAKLSRPFPTKLPCFITSNPLAWLIITIRKCLQNLEIGYSEVVNVQGTWFCCRYSFLQGKIATTNYFSIKLCRMHLRGSHMVDVVSDEGMGSARIVRNTPEYEKGVHVGEVKRLRKIIRECLEEAAKEEKKKRVTATLGAADLELVTR